MIADIIIGLQHYHDKKNETVADFASSGVTGCHY